MENNKRLLDFKTLLPFLPMMMLALSVMAFLSSRQSAVSSEVSVTDDLEDSVTTFSSALSNIIFQNLTSLFSAFYLLINSIDKSLSWQGALAQTTELPNVVNTTVDFLTFQTQLAGDSVTDIFFNSEGNYIFTSNGGNIRVISIDNPLNPINLWSQTPSAFANSNARNILRVTSDNQLFLNGAFYCVFRIVDMNNPVAPVILSEQSFSECSYGRISNNNLILSPDGQSIAAAYSYGIPYISIYNSSNVSNLIASILPSYPVSSFVYSPDGLMMVAAMSTNIEVFNINPQNLSYWKLNNTIACNTPLKTAFTTSNLLLVTYDDEIRGKGFYIYNMSQVNVRTWLSTFNTNSTIVKMISTKNGLRVYAACTAGIFVIDVSNPRQPALLFNATTGVSYTFSLAFDEPESFLYAGISGAMRVFKIHDTILTPTATPFTLTPPTPIPSTLNPPTPLPIAPTNVPPTPVPAAPTNTPPTPDPTDPFNENTPVPQSVAPSDETVAPGQTRVPSVETAVPPASVQIVTNYIPDNKIQIISTVVSLSLQIRIRPYELGMGEFMTNLLPALGAAFNKNTGTLIITDRSPLEINDGLMALRFSSNNATTEGCQVVVIASTDGGITFPFRATGNLSQFGSNAGPVVISNNATLINQTVSFGASFAIYLNQLFNDANNDALSYSVISNTVLNALIQEGILGGLCSVPGVTRFTTTATDGYKQASINNFVTCQYFRPAVRSGAMPAVLTFKAGQRPDAPFSIVEAFTGTGQLTYGALWDGLAILPEGLSFNARRGELSVFKNALAAYNITFTATDIFGNEARATILIQITDIAPVASNITIANVVALAEKTISVMIPNNIIIDPDHDSLTFSIRPAYDWAQLTPSQINIHFLSLTLTPPGNLLGQFILFVIRGSDGYFSAERNLTVIVPANQPPYANIRLGNVTKVTGDDLLYRIVSGAFLSPSNYSLTYSATALDDNNRNVGLPPSLKFDVDTISGELTTDDVGTILIKITAKDTLNSEAFQEFYVTVKFSTLALIQYYAEYWGTRVGIPVTIAGILYAAFQYFQLWPHLYNLLFANCYENKNKFEFDGEKYHCKIEAPEGDFAVKIFIQVKPTDRSCLNALLAKTIGLITSYGREQFTLVEPTLSDGVEEWLSYDRRNGIIAIDYKNIEETHKKAVILVTRRDGRILEKIVVNPADYAKTNKIAKAHRDATRALLVLPEEQQQPSGKQQKPSPKPKSRQPEPELEERLIPQEEGDVEMQEVEMQEREPLGKWSPVTFKTAGVSPELRAAAHPASVEELFENDDDEYDGVEESYETQPAPTEDEERVVNSGGYSATSSRFHHRSRVAPHRQSEQAGTPKHTRRRTESMLSL